MARLSLDSLFDLGGVDIEKPEAIFLGNAARIVCGVALVPFATAIAAAKAAVGIVEETKNYKPAKGDK